MARSGEGIFRQQQVIEDILPVTPIQLAIICREAGDTVSSQVVQYVVDLEGAPRVDLLDVALQRLIRHHCILRSTFLFRGMRRPAQVVRQRLDSAITVEDISTDSAGEKIEPVIDRLLRDRMRGIAPDREPLFRISLFRLGASEFKMVWTFHPLAIDDWSFLLLHFDFWRFYRDAEASSPISSIGVGSRRSYVRFLERQDADDSRRFWRQYLENYSTRSSLPGRSDSLLTGASGWSEHSIVFPDDVSKALSDAAMRYRVAIEAIFLILWGILLQRYSEADDVLFGTVIHGRSAPVAGLKRMAGRFANIVPVRVKAGGESPLREAAVELDGRLRHIRRFGHLPLEEIQAASGIGDRPINHTMTVMARRMGLSRPATLPPGLEVGDIKKWESPNPNACELHCAVIGEKSFEMVISYHSSAFLSPAVERIANDFLCVARRAAGSQVPNIARLTVDIPTILQSGQSRDRSLPGDCHGGLVDKWKDDLQANLPSYMIPSRFVVMEEFPVGPSGKVDRRLLPDPAGPAVTEEALSLRNETERKLRSIWAEVLSVSSTEIGRESDFFQLGGHSLRAVRVSNAIEKTFGVKLEIRTIFSFSTISAMAEEIDARSPSTIPSIQRLESRPYYELSYAQQRIWILCQFNPDGSAFNLPVTVPVTGEPLKREIVEWVSNALIKRHEAFRTYFIEKDNRVVQAIADEAMLSMAYVDLSSLGRTERETRRESLLQQESIRPFDLSHPPLLRLLMIKSAEDEHHLLFAMHHIISDGWSLQVLRREFQSLYEAEKTGEAVILPDLPLQYKDYAHWHNRLLEDGQWSGEAGSFWREQLTGELPPLLLPYDYPRDLKIRSSGSGFRTVIPADVALRLRVLAGEQRASVFVVMLAAFNISLSFLRDQEDIVIGVAGAARQHDDLKYVMGLFVNTLIMRSRVRRDERFLQYLSRVRETALKMLEYQSFPMELACERLGIQYPELNVFFNMLNLGDGAPGGVVDERDGHIPETQDNKFPLSMYVSEFANGIEILCTYLNRLFQPVTIEKIILHYREILSRVAGDPHLTISQLKKSGQKKSLKRKTGALGNGTKEC